MKTIKQNWSGKALGDIWTFGHLVIWNLILDLLQVQFFSRSSVYDNMIKETIENIKNTKQKHMKFWHFIPYIYITDSSIENIIIFYLGSFDFLGIVQSAFIL